MAAKKSATKKKSPAKSSAVKKISAEITDVRRKLAVANGKLSKIRKAVKVAAPTKKKGRKKRKLDKVPF